MRHNTNFSPFGLIKMILNLAIKREIKRETFRNQRCIKIYKEFSDTKQAVLYCCTLLLPATMKFNTINISNS